MMKNEDMKQAAKDMLKQKAKSAVSDQKKTFKYPVKDRKDETT